MGVITSKWGDNGKHGW